VGEYDDVLYETPPLAMPSGRAAVSYRRRVCRIAASDYELVVAAQTARRSTEWSSFETTDELGRGGSPEPMPLVKAGHSRKLPARRGV
jgi:hypothetical protein